MKVKLIPHQTEARIAPTRTAAKSSAVAVGASGTLWPVVTREVRKLLSTIELVALVGAGAMHPAVCEWLIFEEGAEA